MTPAILPWALLIASALLEPVWSAALKESDGFSRPVPALVGVAAATGSLLALGLALRALPLTIAYPVFTALGALAVTVTGVLRFGDSIGPAKLACIALILAGTAGLHLADAPLSDAPLSDAPASPR